VDLDHDGPVPLYVQIADILRDAIRRGDYVPDRPIPSEKDLSDEYGVNRLTARKAVRVLAEEGLVTVVPGRGSYVRRPEG
jgi:GntR family transcriptional regulator